MTRISELIAEHADTQPHAAFLESADGNRSVTFAQCDRAVRSWAARLPAQQPESQTVALAVSDPVLFALAYLGALGAGLRCAPLDPASTERRLSAAAGHAGAEILITDRTDVPGAAPDVLDARAYEHTPPADRTLGGAGSVLLSSSGTTGDPKWVVLTEDQLLHTAHAVARHHGILGGQRGFCPLPLFHINAEVVCLLASLVGGASLVLADRFHRSTFWSDVDDRDVTWINAVPAIIAILARAGDGPRDPSGIRFIRSASAPLAGRDRALFEARFGIPVVESYGMTEACSQITVNPLGARKPGSAGVPVDTEVRIVDDANRPLPANSTGHIVIRGPAVIRAYANPRHDSGFTPGGWLRTGDLGYLDPDGYLFIVGRADDIINRGGEKVAPRVIEECLLAHPAVRIAAVSKAEDAVLGEVPEAYVVLTEGHGPDIRDQLLEHCRRSLTPAEVPAGIHVLPALPTGPTGKVRRNQLRAASAG